AAVLLIGSSGYAKSSALEPPEIVGFAKVFVHVLSVMARSDERLSSAQTAIAQGQSAPPSENFQPLYKRSIEELRKTQDEAAAYSQSQNEMIATAAQGLVKLLASEEQ